MSYKCEQCEQTTTVGDILSTLVKIGMVVGIGYMAFNFKDEIRAAVQGVVKKASATQISGVKTSSAKRSRALQGNRGKK